MKNGKEVTVVNIKPVARIHNDFESKFAVPRQSGIAGIVSVITFEKEYADENAVREIEGFSHLWLIWGFSENEGRAASLTVRPPRLGGNKRVGVFASRSPYRPNGLGLSSVKLEAVQYDDKRHPMLLVSGADLMNGTPIYDIKPYIPFTDCHSDAAAGFVDSTPFPVLQVSISEKLLQKIPSDKHQTLFTILENDPRPAYQEDADRVYGFPFAGYEIHFTVKDGLLTVTEIDG